MFIDLPPVLKFVKELKKVAMVKKNVHIRLVTEGFQAEGCIVKIKQIACPVTHPELLSKGFGVVVFFVFCFADHKKSSVRRNVNVGPFCLDSSTLPSSDYAHMIWAKYSLTTWNVSVMFHISTAVQKYSLLRCISNHPWQWKWDFINSIIWCNHSDGSCDRCQPHCNSWFDGWQYW